MKLSPWLKTWLVGSVILFMIAGCGKETNIGTSSDPGELQQPKAVDSEPVTISLWAGHAWLSDEEIQTYMTEPLAQKYPNITLQVVRPGSGTEITELIAAGDIPDLIVTGNTNLPSFCELELCGNLDPIIEANRFDLSRFESADVEATRNASDHNVLSALPYATNFPVLYYNKDLFDKFGVDNPTDGMTWEETIALGKIMTRVVDRIQYVGLDVDNQPTYLPSGQLGLVFADPNTRKASMQSEGWRRAYELIKEVKTIPEQPMTDPFGSFIRDRTLAMWATWNSNAMSEATKEGLQWDMVQFPSYKDQPNISHMVDAFVMIISATSKQKDAALQAIEVLTSDEVQLTMARNGKASVLKNKEVKEQFGQNQTFLSGKNISGPFKSKAIPAPKWIVTPGEANGLVGPLFNEFVAGTKDINTVLRETDEMINNFIEAYKSK